MKRTEIKLLSEIYNIREDELRNLLFLNGIIIKRRLKYLDSYQLKKFDDIINKKLKKEQSEQSLKNLQKDTPAEKVSSEVTTEKTKKRKQSKDREWFIVGQIEPQITYLSPKDIKEIHEILVEDFKKSKDPIDPPGVKNQGLLESAVFRPRTSLGFDDKYPTIAMAGAALLHAIIHNHPFHNGNKRTALVSLIVFLDKNGWILAVNPDIIYDFLVTLAAHQFVDKTKKIIKDADSEMLYIAQWLRSNIRRVSKGEYPLQFRLLRDILIEFGCECKPSVSGGLTMKISRDNFQTSIQYGGDGREIRPQVIHKIRRDLKLDEAHGFDSDIFYNKGPRIPEFILKYRRVLDKLAKV